MMLQACLKNRVKQWIAQISQVRAHHHDDVREDVAVLVNESADASGRHRELLAEPSAALLVFFSFFFCNDLISFNCSKEYFFEKKRTQNTSWETKIK